MSTKKTQRSGIRRRDFLVQSAAAVGALGVSGAAGADSMAPGPTDASEAEAAKAAARVPAAAGKYNGVYSGERLNRIAFPMGGIGAGMICLEGTGALSHVSLRNRPEVYNEPCVFAAVALKDAPNNARVLEGPVPGRKLFGPPGTGNGAGGTTYGLPRFAAAKFQTRFPFGSITLSEPRLPLRVELVG